MLEIDILRNYVPKDLVVLRGEFLGYWVPKKHPGAQLGETIYVLYPFPPQYSPEQQHQTPLYGAC